MGTKRQKRTSTGARRQERLSTADLAAEISEKDYQQQIVDLARLQGWRVFHCFDSRRSEPGFPDLILVRGITMLCMEVKREDAKMDTAQQVWLDLLQQVRTVSAVMVKPSQWGIVAETLVKAK
jgi:hypothetical protein